MRRLPSQIGILVFGFSLVLAGACESSSKGAAETEAQSSHETGSEKKRGGHRDGHEKHGGHGDEHRNEGSHHGKKEHHEAKTISLSKKAVERYGVQVKKAKGGNLANRVSATAKVKHDPSNITKVSPLVRGQIAELKVTVGDRVEAGETLAVVRSSELGEARAAVNEAEARHEIAKSNHERVKKLYDQNIVSEKKLLDARQAVKETEAKLEAAGSKLSTFGVPGGSGPFYPIQSGIAGRVIEQDASEGEVKGPGATLYVVASNQPVWVIGQVAETNIAKVSKGMKATVTVDAYPSRKFDGTVDWVADTVDSKTRNMNVRVALPNDDGALRPGMFGAVHLRSDRGEDYAIVPVGSVQQAHGKEVVFVPIEKARGFRAKTVETGAESQGLVEVRSGLAPGEEFVTRGAFDLKATLTASSRSGGHHH